jgi:hypothetical protein
MKVHGG